MTPRLRMLAGPNGSGKSTLAAQLSSDYAVNLYRFVNADLLFAEVVQSHRTACPFSIDNAELVEFVAQSTYPREYKRPFESGEIYIDEEDYLHFSANGINSYSVAIVADFFKEQYLKHRISFSFETVFSHPAKIDILRRAQAAGFKTYMYFVATENPVINVNRIKERVALGGHDVPEEKTRSRYLRCMEQVRYALPYLNRAYFFDNSTQQSLYLAEYESEVGFSLHSELLPSWFRRFVLGE
ncbi:hypothetical protein FYJ85_17015 [Victivallaceae bacterium BBE-744-WT-12]|uniref:UDP-N-acetylglucosamine kinase n=1 Tax=Victivallis lenta TaxID=2606640 RepID=A0A844G6H3_9BACT|nr:hypothetical protein [Victivallis lenta]MST98743.1 hypothetical protein [Victivallis lenta]